MQWKILLYFLFIYFISGLFLQTLTTRRTAGKGRELIFYLSLPFLPAHKHLFGTLYVRWLSHIFNRTACIYHTVTWWDLPAYRTNVWVMDHVVLIFCLFAPSFNSRFLLQQFDTGEPVYTNSHQLSPLHFKRTG